MPGGDIVAVGAEHDFEQPRDITDGPAIGPTLS